MPVFDHQPISKIVHGAPATLDRVAMGRQNPRDRAGVQHAMSEQNQAQPAGSCSDNASWPIMICLLGNFRLLQAGALVPIRAGGKSEALLAHLGLQAFRRVARERLIQALWPESDPILALNSLYNLVSRRLDDLTAVVCHSDMERTGWFECSDPLISRLHENVVWSMRGNFLDVPTDCPQRDERLGWTGDIQVFAPTACFLFDTAGLLRSWLADLAAEQADADGVIPFVVPNVLPGTPIPAAAWGDAAVIVPWVLYQRYGDTRILAEQFESIRAWVDLLANIAEE